MEESWDDDNFEPPAVTVAPVASNKWEGEDEEEDVKDNWEDEEEEKEREEGKATEPQPKPKKMGLAERIAEKERKKREEKEKQLREQQEEEMSVEERLRLQKESDLKLALETTFGGDHAGNNVPAGLDLDLPTTKEEFDEFSDKLYKKLQPLSKNTEYPNFTENLVRNLCATMSSLDIKKIKNTLDNLYLEKQKIEKGEKTKKNKGKGKAKLKLEHDGNPLSAYTDDFVDEFEDFM